MGLRWLLLWTDHVLSLHHRVKSEPGARLTSAPGNSSVMRSAQAVDVAGDSDLQAELSALTTSLRGAPSVIGQA
jgi:hypothetical protein